MSRQSSKVPRVCEHCQAEFLVFPSQIKHGVRYCSVPCKYAGWQVPTLREAFDRHCGTLVTTPAGCLLWGGIVDRDGYGKLPFEGSSLYAHRAAWELHHGAIAPGVLILHHCDTPGCVHVPHLFSGTQADNMRDMRQKRRGTRRIPDEVIREIRRLHDEGHPDKIIRLLYPYSKAQIYRVARRQNHRELI